MHGCLEVAGSYGEPTAVGAGNGPQRALVLLQRSFDQARGSGRGRREMVGVFGAKTEALGEREGY